MSTYKGTALVTGGTAGLGYNAALQIAKQHPDYFVIISSRKDNDSSAAKINSVTGQQNVEFQPLDLSSLNKVRDFCESYSRKENPPIKALLLNAALQFPNEPQFSVDGIEMTFAITHVGHALLFYLLQPYLAQDARIVITASGVHDPAQKTGMPPAKFVKAEELAHPPEGAKADGRLHYCNAKMANVMWAYALHRKLKSHPSKERRWTVNSFDPGLMPGTGLGREYSAPMRFVWSSVLPRMLPLLRRLVSPNIFTPEQSGQNLARLGVGKDAQDISGVYFEGNKEIKSSVDSYKEPLQDELYEWTIDNVARTEEEKSSFRDI